MPNLERETGCKPGAQFSKDDDGNVQFMYVIDASSIVGPRKATDRDKETYSGEWAAFSETLRSEPAPDHKPADNEGAGADSAAGRDAGSPSADDHGVAVATAASEPDIYVGYERLIDTPDGLRPAPPKNRGGRPRKVK